MIVTKPTAQMAAPDEYSHVRELIQACRAGGLNDEEIRAFVITAALMMSAPGERAS